MKNGGKASKQITPMEDDERNTIERRYKATQPGARFAAKLTTVLAEVDHPKWV